jgi:hypothetical protein
MDYLQAWQDGFKAAKDIELELINTHCDMQFESLTDLILYIRDVEFMKKLEQENV